MLADLQQQHSSCYLDSEPFDEAHVLPNTRCSTSHDCAAGFIAAQKVHSTALSKHDMPACKHHVVFLGTAQPGLVSIPFNAEEASAVGVHTLHELGVSVCKLSVRGRDHC